MSIRRLRTLVAVAEQGSFGLAAESVSISQAAVSLQMKALEDELQVTLFDRSKRPPILNSTGLALVEKAREAIRAYDELAQSVTRHDILAGELALGAMPTTMTGVVPKAMSALREIYPELRIHVVPNHATDQLPQFERGLLDAAIISQPPHLPEYLDYKPFAEEPLVILAPLDCPWDTPEELLANYPFIRFDRKQWVGQLIDDWLRSEGIQINDLMELDTIESVSNMVYHNLGVTIIPKQCIASPNPIPLKTVPLGPSAPPRVLGLLVRRDTPKSRLTDVLFDQLVNLVEMEAMTESTPSTVSSGTNTN